MLRPKHLATRRALSRYAGRGRRGAAPGRTGRPLEFATFFADEHRELFRLLCFVTGNRADAADLMQEAFLKLWERWDRVQQIADPRAYLFRVALNGSRRRTRAALRAARRLVPIASSYDPFDEVNLREDLRQILLGLSQRQGNRHTRCAGPRTAFVLPPLRSG